VITAQKLVVFGWAVDTPVKRYLLVLAIVSVMALAAKNMVRSSIGRAWMAVRDMDVAAEVVGIPDREDQAPRLCDQFVLLWGGRRALRVRISGHGRAGGVRARAFLQDPLHDHHRRRRQHPGFVPRRRFIVLLPIFMDLSAASIERSFGFALPAGLVSNLTLILFGALIIFFLVVEPLGLARLWQIAKEKLRLWPFPH